MADIESDRSGNQEPSLVKTSTEIWFTAEWQDHNQLYSQYE